MHIMLSIILIFTTCKSLTPLADYQYDVSDIDAVILSDFAVKTQPDKYSCGVATIAMVYSHLIKDITVTEVQRKLDIEDKKSITQAEFKEYVSAMLGSGYNVQLKEESGDTELLQNIYLQLAENIPVPVFFVAPNAYKEGTYDIHVSAVTGIHPEKETVTIANAYGFTEEISINSFLNRMHLRAGDKLPFMQSLNVRLGAIKENTMFVIKRK